MTEQVCDTTSSYNFFGDVTDFPVRYLTLLAGVAPFSMPFFVNSNLNCTDILTIYSVGLITLENTKIVRYQIGDNVQDYSSIT